AAARMIGEAASRKHAGDPKAMLDYFKSADFTLAAFKGQRLTLRDWNQQLRQPILLADGRVIVSVSPQEGFLHQVSELDTLVQDHDGKILYVANENDNTVTMIDIEKRARLGDVQVGVEPEGMGISPDGKFIVNTSETTNMVHFIDTATREIVGNVLVDARPRFAEFKQDGSELWISAEIGGTVSVIDPVRREIKQKISFEIPGLRREAIQPVGISMTRDGKTGFVALGPANRVAII